MTIVVSSFEEPSETPTPTPSDTPTVLPTDTPTATPSGGPPRHRPSVAWSRSAVGLQRLGVGDVEQAVVRRRGDGGLDVGLPADRDVRLGGVAAVELEVVVVGDRRGERAGSPTAEIV